MSADDSPKALVRSFSSDLEQRDGKPSNELERIVVERERLTRQADTDWRIYFEPWKPSEECGNPIPSLGIY